MMIKTISKMKKDHTIEYKYAKAKKKVEKTTAKKVTELMELQGIVIGMHKKIASLETNQKEISSKVNKINARLGL